MIQITLNFTEQQAQAMAPAIEAEARNLLRNPDVLLKLPDGVTAADVESWPIRRKAKLVIYAKLMFVQQTYDREAARIAAGDAAGAAARDTAAFEVDDA